MADDASLNVVIRALLESKGFDDLQRRLKQTKVETQEASVGAKDFSGALADMGGKLLAASGLMIGVAEAVGFLKDSFKAFVEEERILNQFDATNRVLGGTLGRNTAANREWLESLEITSGRMKSELIPSYERLVAVTGDVSEAQRITQIAALAAKAGLGDVAMVTQSLIKYMETGQFSIRGGGAALKEMAGNAKDTSTGLENLEKRVRELASGVENIAVESDRLNIRWERTKEILGSVGSAFIGFKSEVLEIVAKAMGGLAIGLEYVTGTFQKVAVVAKTAFAVIKSAASGDLAAAEHAVTELGGKLTAIEIDMQLKMAGIKAGIENVWSHTETKLNEDTKRFKDHTDTQGKALDELKKKYEDLANNAVHLGMEEVQARLAVVKVYQQMANDPAIGKFPDLQAEANKRLVASVNALGQAVAKEAEDDIRATKALEKAQDDAFDSWFDKEKKRVAASRKAADDEFKLEQAKYKALEKQGIGYLEQYKNFLAQQLVLFKGTAEEEARIRRELASVSIRLEQMVADAQLAIAQQSVQLLGAVFGQTKGVAIAQAIINTYEGATKALAQGGIYGEVLAAIVIATGLAQVATMVATEPQTNTSGFDDPNNDFAAVAGGRKWARDMVGYYSQGAALGFSEGMRSAGGVSNVSNVTNRGGNTFHITLSAGVGSDRVSLMKFVKNDLVPVLNRYDQQRTMR